MINRFALLAIAVAGASAFAIFHSAKPKPATAEAVPAASGARDAFDSLGAKLPADHPPVGHPAASASAVHAAADEAPAIAWTGPSGWQTSPNPNALRLATYHVQAAPGDADGAEVTVTRAGGTVDANIERWLGQFDDAGQEKRTEKKVRGLNVTVVEVSGTYLGNAMMGGASAKRKAWSFVGAIVQTTGTSYFFKLVGPTATVRGARASYDAMIDSIAPMAGAGD